MLTDFTIKNFRGIKELTLPKLSRVNLFVGKNGVGKTSVLEAILLYLRAGHPGHLMDLLGRRAETKLGRSRYDLMSQLFTDVGPDGASLALGPGNAKREIHLRKDPDIEENTLPPPTRDELFELFVPHGPLGFTLRVPIKRPESIQDDSKGLPAEGSAQNFILGSAAFLPSSVPDDAGFEFLWNDLQLQWKQQRVVDALRLLYPNIEGVDVIASRTPIVKLTGEGVVPLARLGEGALRTFALALVLGSGAKTVLIDEIENGLHYSIQQEVWRFLIRAASELDVQIFATTHSRDAVYALAEASKGDDHKVYRLERWKDDIEAVKYDVDMLRFSAEEALEVR